MCWTPRILALMLGLWSWGCGGGRDAAEDARADAGTAEAASRDRVDACALVPKQEVATIVGGSIADASGDFSEHTYTKPVSFTASCRYMGERAVMLGVNYPVPPRRGTSAQLASTISERLRSQAEGESDPGIAELYQSIEVRPVEGLAGPAAEYAMLDQTTLEASAGGYRLTVMAPSLESARTIAAKAFERLE
jgi:hypothetical protein